MIRRFCAFLLVLACAFAPALPVQSAPATKTDCCCHRKCPCAPERDCAPPPTAPLRAPAAANAAAPIAQRVAAAKPALRPALVAFRRFLSASTEISAPSIRPVATNRSAPAATVALFEAHCSRLI